MSKDNKNALLAILFMSILSTWYLFLYFNGNNKATESEGVNPVAVCMEKHTQATIGAESHRLACAKCIGNAMIAVRQYYGFSPAMHDMSEMIAPTSCSHYENLEPIKTPPHPKYLLMSLALFILILLVVILPHLCVNRKKALQCKGQ